MSTNVLTSANLGKGSPYCRLVGRMVDADHLVGSEEIARRLDVKRRQTVHTWRMRSIGFPDPIAVVDHRTLVWNWPDIEQWARNTGRYPVRPGPLTPVGRSARSRRST